MKLFDGNGIAYNIQFNRYKGQHNWLERSEDNLCDVTNDCYVNLEYASCGN